MGGWLFGMLKIRTLQMLQEIASTKLLLLKYRSFLAEAQPELLQINSAYTNYTVSQKNRAHILYLVTLANVNQF